MSPWVNIALIVPAIIIIGSIVLIRIKSKLENKIFHYRHEGIILQTSLAFFLMRNPDDLRRRFMGMAILTGERLVVFNWKQIPVFECEFHGAGTDEPERCELRPGTDKKNITVYCRCEKTERQITMGVRNADAWQLEFSRLRSYESSE